MVRGRTVSVTGQLRIYRRPEDQALCVSKDGHPWGLRHVGHPWRVWHTGLRDRSRPATRRTGSILRGREIVDPPSGAWVEPRREELRVLHQLEQKLRAQERAERPPDDGSGD